MVSSKQSPIVHVGVVRDTRQYLRYQSSPLFEYKDVMLTLLAFLAIYGLFMYYILPNTSYRQATNQLYYQWQPALVGLQQNFQKASFALSQHPVLGEWYQYLFTPW